MNSPTPRSLFAAVLLAAAVLIAGSVSTAAAAGLTEQAVKKIATKVVKKQAKRLTVANSTKLGGQPPAAYQSPTYVFSSTITDPIHDAQIPISLPAGRYLIGYSIVMGGAVNTDVDCDFELGSLAFAETKTQTTTTPGLSGLGFVDTTSGAPLKLHCSSPGPSWATGTAEPIQIVATRVDLAQVTTVPALTS
jgi:hypothetical protein